MSGPGTVEGRAHARLFLALELPEATVDRLVAWQQRELRGRIVPPGNLHVTLAFLGKRPAVEVEAIGAELRESAGGAERPLLTVRAYRETRSVGMLVLEDRDGHAATLARDLHGRLERLGVYRPESRPWLPHLTVLRFRDRPRLHPELPDLGNISPSEAAVYHSVLRPGGAQYEVLETVSLGG